MSLRNVFPTVIYEAALDDPGLVSDLDAASWMLEEGDAAGRAWCEENGYPGYTSYASLDDLPRRASVFEALAARLRGHAEAFADALAWDLDGRPLRLDALWVNMLGEGGAHTGHLHPGSAISGTAYVAVPEGSGALKLEDPRLAMMMAAPQPRDDAPEAARRFVYLKPKPGDLLMWESWLRHEVVAGTNEVPRISISFNFALGPA